MTIAVILTGGKQYLVKEGQTVTIEKIPGVAGGVIDFQDVLLVAKDGADPNVGRPIVPGAHVSGKILSQGLGPKISVIKFKRKIRYKRSHGHRQAQTVVMIDRIGV